jgi:two-component system KDP operon response regulator KdpE
MAAKLLLIDSDAQSCEWTRGVFRDKRYAVEVAYGAVPGLQKAYATSPDLVLLDMGLPNGDGWQACSRLRDLSDLPILILVPPDLQSQVVRALDLGADAYVVKPVSREELLARIGALLRRPSSGSRAVRHSWLEPLALEHLVIDLSARSITVDGAPVNLSRTEFDLLALMARYNGRVLSHEYLLREVWGPDYADQIEYLRLYISYLRRKIDKDRSRPSLIQNEWGIGYRLG